MGHQITLEECVETGIHLIDCDDDGFCNSCGCQDCGDYEEEK